MQTRSFLHYNVSPEGLGLTTLCMADLASTLFWISQGHAREGNPLMAWILSAGVVPFIAAKIVMFAPAVVLAEWYRPRNPALITRVMRWVIGGYVVAWVAGIGAHSGRVIEFYRNLLLG